MINVRPLTAVIISVGLLNAWFVTREHVFTGAERAYRDIELMLGKRIAVWWKACWMVISPTILLVSHLTRHLTGKSSHPPSYW